MKEYGYFDDFLGYDTEGVLIETFKDDDEDDLLPEERRWSRLHLIYEYAMKNGLFEAARHVEAAEHTNENPYDLLAEIGFSYEGDRVFKVTNPDAINVVPERRKVLNEDQKDDV